MIRKITENDRAEYLSLCGEFYGSDAVLHNVPAQNFEKTFAELMRSDAYARAYVFEEDGAVVGYALLALTFSQEAGGMVVWVEELYVREAFRSKGYGRQFFAKLHEEYADAARIRLEVEEENYRAVNLYRKMGFSELAYNQFIKE